jgi:hypothetical protein
MGECPKRIPTKLARQVFHSDPGADVPDVPGIGESEVARRASHGFSQEPLVFWITTDDPIQCDDVGRNKLTGDADKITLDESHRVGSASTYRLCRRRRDIGRRKVDTYCVRHSALEKLERHRADARSDIEQSSIWLPGLRNAPASKRRAVAPGPFARYCARSFVARFSLNCRSAAAPRLEPQQLIVTYCGLLTDSRRSRRNAVRSSPSTWPRNSRTAP